MAAMIVNWDKSRKRPERRGLLWSGFAISFYFAVFYAAVLLGLVRGSDISPFFQTIILLYIITVAKYE